MKRTTLKILTASGFLFLALLRCGDYDIMNAYNKYTEVYRENPDEMMNHNDSCITGKVLNSANNRPLSDIYLVLTLPAGDTITAMTNKDGYAEFRPGVITTGSYIVKAVIYLNGTEHSTRSTYYLNEKNNLTFTMYITENNLYR